MADISKITLPNGDSYDIKDNGAVRINDGTLTGTTTAESLLSDEVVAGSLIVNGDARFVNTINGDISGNAVTATKAVQDGNGSTISSTYMKLSGTNTNSATNTFSGSNTFSNKAFYYTGIENGTTDAARVVWFADASYKGKPVYNESFKYNPSTNVLTVGSITGSAASATTATTATKLGSSNVGAADRPIYLNAGTATQTTYRMAGTNAVVTTAVAITDNLNTGIWYVNGTNSTDLFSQTDGAVLVNKYSDNWISEIYQDYRTGQIALRGKNNGTWQSWRKVLDSSNYTSWAVSLTTAQTISGVKTFSVMPIAKAGVRVSNTGNTEGCDFVYDDTTQSVLMSFH